MNINRFVTGAILTLFFMSFCGCGGCSSRQTDAEMSENSLPGKIVSLSASGNVIIYGDTRGGKDVHHRLVEKISAENPVAVFFTGDLVADGTDAAEWKTQMGIIGPLMHRSHFYAVLGNHEMLNASLFSRPDYANATEFFRHFDLPGNEQWYGVSASGVLYLVLNSVQRFEPDTDQYRWVDGALQSASKEKYVVIVTHYPVFSSGMHGDTPNLVENLLPLLKKYRVSAIFSAHDHDYERLDDGIVYIISGGGGAPLRGKWRNKPESKIFKKCYHYCRITGLDVKSVEAVGINGEVFDSFVLPPRR